MPGNPTVFAQVTTENEAEAVCTRVRNVTTSDFQYFIQEEEKGGNGVNRNHVLENVDYVAIQQGASYGSGTAKYEIINTGGSVTHNDYTIEFLQTYSNDRRLFLQDQSTYGGDPGVIRYRHNNGYTGDEVKVFFQEERSKNDPGSSSSEIAHGAEVCGYLIFDASGALNRQSGSGLAAPSVATIANYVTETTETILQEPTLTAQPIMQSVQLGVYPNPNAGTFTLGVETEADFAAVNAQLIDAIGRIVHATQLALYAGANQIGVDTRPLNLAAGVYTVRLLNNGQLLGQERVIIR